MKLTKSKLKEIIREELLNEEPYSRDKILEMVRDAYETLVDATLMIKKNYGTGHEYHQLRKASSGVIKFWKDWK